MAAMSSTGGRVRIVVTSPLERQYLDEIAMVDPRLEVVYPEDLVAPARYPADHSLPKIENPDQRARWDQLLDSAQIMFDFGPTSLAAQLPGRPRLRWIQATSAGVGQFAERCGLTRSDVVVTTASGVHARPIAEFALMAMLMFVKNAFKVADDQREHRWQRYAGEEIAGKTVVIVGVGRIGREIARLVRALDARVLGTVRSVADRDAEDLFLEALYPNERLEDLLPLADFVVLCTPHTAETNGLLTSQRLALFKPDAVLINVARGAIVDESALIEALRAGRLRGAALDVFEREPLPSDSPLWDMPNVIISPHSASTSVAENRKIIDLFTDNIHRYLDSRPLRNVLDPKLLY